MPIYLFSGRKNSLDLSLPLPHQSLSFYPHKNFLRAFPPSLYTFPYHSLSMCLVLSLTQRAFNFFISLYSLIIATIVRLYIRHQRLKATLIRSRILNTHLYASVRSILTILTNNYSQTFLSQKLYALSFRRTKDARRDSIDSSLNNKTHSYVCTSYQKRNGEFHLLRLPKLLKSLKDCRMPQAKLIIPN